MLPLKSGQGHQLPDLSSLSLPRSKSLSAELAFWENLHFDFDMDNGPRKQPSKDSSQPHDAQQSRSTSSTNTNQQGGNYGHGNYPDLHDAALLAQFAAAMGVNPQGSGQSQMNPFNTMIPGGNYPYHHIPYNQGMPQANAQLPSLSGLDFSWNNYPPHLRPHSNPGGTLSGLGGPSTLPDPGSSSASSSQTPAASSSSRTRATRSRSVSVASPTQEPEGQTEAEQLIIAEEKRRRNTAASARFRVKKKQRIINLERTVSDLTGRADDLEKEAADLRRENGWLKEIIMLKGSRLAGIDIANQLAEGSQSSAAGSSRSHRDPSATAAAPTRNEEESSSSEEESEEEKPKARRKGKSTKK